MPIKDTNRIVFSICTTVFAVMGMFCSAQASVGRGLSVAEIFFICLVGGIFGIAIGLFSVKILSAYHESKSAVREEKLARYRELVRKKIEANVQAQLHKTGFDTRLNQFVSANVESSSEPADPEEPFVSRVPFWQRETFRERTMPKPIELIRRLLQHISKVVQGSKT